VPRRSTVLRLCAREIEVNFFIGRYLQDA
jgi:hypothetical protein